MKKLVVIMLAVLTSGAAYALPVGNPSEASLMCDGVFCEGWCGDVCDPCMSWCDAWSVRLGFYGDYVFERHLEAKQDAGTIQHSELFTNAVYLAVNLFDRVDIFTSLGVSNFYFETPGEDFGFPFGNALVQVASKTDFSWSVGARATLWECGCFALGLEGQYFSTRPKYDYVIIQDIQLSAGGINEVYYPDNTFHYQEWQVGLGASYRINISSCSTALVPYIAVKWADGSVDADDARVVSPLNPDFVLLSLKDLEMDKHWGLAVGVTLLGCNKTAITVEGRFADEKALYVNGQFRF